MPEFTYAVTQNVLYTDGVEADKPEDILELFDDGEWDTGHNEVKWDRVQVFDADDQLVYDTHGPTVTVHTLTVDGYGGPVCTMAFGTEQESWDALRERYLDSELGDDPRTMDDFSNEEMLAFLTDDPGGYSIYFDVSEVTL